MKVTLFFIFCLLPSAFCFAAVDWNNPDAVVQAVIDVNPSLASLSAQIRAAKERVAPAGSLPNPMLMGGAQNEPVNLSYDFMTMYWVGASQTLVDGRKSSVMSDRPTSKRPRRRTRSSRPKTSPRCSSPSSRPHGPATKPGRYHRRT